MTSPILWLYIENMLPAATMKLNRLRVHRGGPETIYRQLCKQIRELILTGELVIGTRLPSTRELADALTISRTTIRDVYEQLIAESYLSSSRGRGTFVINHPVVKAISLERATRTAFGRKRGGHAIRKPPVISERGRQFLSIPLSHTAPEVLPFNPALPDFTLFPFLKWSRILKKTLVRRDHAAMDYGDAAGFAPLKDAIARNLHHFRGLNCDPSQVIIVGSSEQAIRRIVFLLLDRDECIWFGEPGLHARHNAFRTAGVNTCSVSVDDQGVVVDEAYRFKEKVKLAYVVPSSHYPLGNVMSLPRRLEMLNWASANNAWILEDDFGCEFSFTGQAPPPIQSMDMDQRVIYMGGYSLTLFPSLRIAYLVVPENLVNAAENMAQAEQSVSAVLQPALAEFISAGHFMAYIRTMRKTYYRREQFLVQFLNRHLADEMTITGTGVGGPYLVLNLPARIKDHALSETLAEIGIIAHPLSSYYIHHKHDSERRNGLVLGFGCSPRVDLERCANQLVALVNTA